MRKEQLERYASELEMDCDSMAYLLMKARKMMQLQSVCDFNVWWMADISPLLMPIESIDFLVHHRNEFNRKITAREFVKYDAIIKLKKPETFGEFKEYVSTQTLFLKPNKIKYKQK